MIEVNAVEVGIRKQLPLDAVAGELLLRASLFGALSSRFPRIGTHEQHTYEQNAAHGRQSLHGAVTHVLGKKTQPDEGARLISRPKMHQVESQVVGTLVPRCMFT